MRVTVEYVKSLNANTDVSMFAIKAAEKHKKTNNNNNNYYVNPPPPHNFRNVWLLYNE